jgi:glycosyltransferase involved in cell wall biosynthesis
VSQAQKPGTLSVETKNGARATVSAIVPARNEEATIAACVEGLANQTEIHEILVVDDQSTDKTAEIVRGLMVKFPQVRLIEAGTLPEGWVGKNHAAWTGAKEAQGECLLFTDADAQAQAGAVDKALRIMEETRAGLVSFSPEQVTVGWYEKALIPFIYCRLAKYFSYDAVNDPAQPVAAANGQFLTIHRDSYFAVGGHAAVAGEVLEDVALARRIKEKGYRIRFGPSDGLVRVRMYRSFGELWRGWKKNLYLLIGGTPGAVYRELGDAFPWIPLVVLGLSIKMPIVALLGVWLVIFRQIGYGRQLRRNQFRYSLILYYVPAVALYVALLWASYRGHARGKVEWKGREVPVGAANQSK